MPAVERFEKTQTNSNSTKSSSCQERAVDGVALILSLHELCPCEYSASGSIAKRARASDCKLNRKERSPVKSYSRIEFLNFSGIFLFGLLILTVFLSWLTSLPLASQVTWSLRDVGIGVAAACVMFLAFFWITPLRDQAGEAIGRSLAVCYWYDFIILAIIVGIVEEFLFRGFLEQWIGRWNPWAGFILANLFFGLLHAISPLYAIVAMLLGALLSWLAWGIGDYNLLRPIVAHAVYDCIGFVLIAREYREKLRSELEVPSDS